MKFLARRTSGSLAGGKPCEGAFMADYVRADVLYTPDPSQIRHEPTRNTWFDSGRNHRAVNGAICRDFDAQGWMVEIGSLEELLEFSKQADCELVVDADRMQYGEPPAIEIYDTYRE